LLLLVSCAPPSPALADFSAGFAPGIASGEQQVTELYITLDKSRMNYEREILGRIERAKRYPSSARRQGLEGAPVVDFTLSRDGQLTALRLGQTSSVDLLDQEALQIISRAAPFPEAPESFPGEGLRFQVPIAFRLKK